MSPDDARAADPSRDGPTRSPPPACSATTRWAVVLSRPNLWKRAAGAIGALGALVLFAALLTKAGRVAVTGRVTNDRGQPLTGLTVRAILQSFMVPWSDNLQPPGDPREFQAVTDRAGRFRLHGLSAEPYRGAGSTLGQWLVPLRLFFRNGQRFPQEYELVVDANGFALQKIQIATDRRHLQDVDFIF
jgi:hypothetical protein